MASKSAQGRVRRSMGTAATMMAAARSLARSQAMSAGDPEGEVGELLRERALLHFGRTIVQHLTICLGDAGKAREILAELRRRVPAIDPRELVEAPGMRARLLRLAREIAGIGSERRAIGGDTIPWRRQRSASPGSREEGVAEIRRGALGDDAALLELRFAHQLELPEIAFVLGLPEAGLGERLEGAIERARQLLAHGGAGSSIIPEALVEVFALEDEEDDELEPMLEPGTLVGGRYRVAQQIGSGGFADVYRAEDQEVEGHVVALKVLHRKALTDAARAQALRELHLIASVFHPSIVQFKDHGWFDDRFWFVMPWYQGESLESRIERGPLDRLEAKRIFVPLARALAAMHSAGMRHQDVKPDNIFLTRLEGFGGEGGDDVLPVLLDLGVAAKEAELLLAGTPDYFAPEVAAQFARVPSSAAIGAPADVFSLALSLRNALEPETSEILEEEAIDAFIEARAMRPPEPPRGRALRFLRPSFRRWMSPDPSERPSAERFAEELSILTLPEERRQRRIRVLIVALPLLLAATAIFLGVAWRLDQRAREEERRAELARDEAAGARASLEEAEERRRELETKVAQTEERYLSSRLTRDQLAGRLAQEEAGLAFAREDLERSRRRILALGESLRESQEQAEELERRLSSERRAKQVVEARVLELDAELARVRAELEAARVSLAAASAEAERGAAQLEEARASLAAATRQVEEASAGARASEAQASEAESRLQAAEARVEAAEARARSADERIAAAEGEARQAEERARQAEAERARAESELERARRRIAELEREPQAEVPRVPPGPELSPSGMRPRPRRP